MTFDAIWPRHIPRGLTLSREEYRGVKERARTLRERDPNFRDARKKDKRYYFLVVLPVLPIFVYLVNYADQSLLGFTLISSLGVYAMYIKQRTHQPFIRRALCEAGHEVCIDCGYLLRGLLDDVEKCPECGAMREYRDVARAVREIVADEWVSEPAITDQSTDAHEPEVDDYKPLPKYRWD